MYAQPADNSSNVLLSMRPQTRQLQRRPPSLQMQMTPLVSPGPYSQFQLYADGTSPATSPLVEMRHDQLHRTHSAGSMASGSSSTTYSSSTPGSLLQPDYTGQSTPGSSPIDMMAYTNQRRLLKRSMSSSSLASSSNFSVISDSSSASAPLHHRLRSSTSISSLPTIPALSRSLRGRNLGINGTFKQRRSSKLTDGTRKQICEYARDNPRENQDSIGSKFGIERSTVSKILKDKERWLNIDEEEPDFPFAQMLVDSESESRAVNPPRASKFPQLENAITAWIQQRRAHNHAVSDEDVKTFARTTAAQMHIKTNHFKASNTWLERYKLRIGCSKPKTEVYAHGPSTILEQPSELEAEGEAESSPTISDRSQFSSASTQTKFSHHPNTRSFSLSQSQLHAHPLSIASNMTVANGLPHPMHVNNYADTYESISDLQQHRPHSAIIANGQAQSIMPNFAPSMTNPHHLRIHTAPASTQHVADLAAQIPEPLSAPIMRPMSRRSTISEALPEAISDPWQGNGITRPIHYNEAVGALETLSQYISQRTDIEAAISSRALQEIASLFGIQPAGANYSPQNREWQPQGLGLEYG